MTSKADYTDEEWARLKRAPFVAGMAISLADPGGPIEAVKETAATLKTVRAAEAADRGSWCGRSPARSSRTRGNARARSADSSRARARRPASRSSTSSARSTGSSRRRRRRRTPRRCASGCCRPRRRPANAAKEGGFMGFHAERVSEGEQRMLERLRGVLSDS